MLDGDLALVRLSSPPLASRVRRGRLPETRAGEDLPPDGLGHQVADSDGPWLVAPVHDGLDASRGQLALRREGGGSFGLEEREILALLARLGATTLASIELTRAVARSEERLRTIVETAPVGLVEVDGDDLVQWWNPTAGSILAWGPATEGGAPTFPPESRAALRELWAAARAEGPRVGADLDDVLIGGRARQLALAAAPLRDGAVLTLIEDITESRQLRAELRYAHTMEVRGQVASRVAHDFNNLITLISGYAEMLTRQLEPDEAPTALVRDIQATASRAALLTVQLQSIGRTKATEPVRFNPASVVAANAEVLERILGRTIDLILELDHEAGAVMADPDQFEQMVLNLSINARDALPEGGRLTWRVRHETLTEPAGSGPGPGEYVRLEVSDDGVGMDAETQRRCFEPLFTTKGAFRGTGMGLAAAQRLVSESGGLITVRSAPGEGTTFTIWLPRVGDAAEEEARAEVARPRGDARVMVVDDDAGLRHLMGQVLRRNGYEVLEAASGEEALTLLEGEAVDLLVSDVVMEGLGGPELARRIQGLHPQVVIVMVSGTHGPEVLEGLTPGSAAFVAKPFKPSALIDQAHELLARRADYSGSKR